MFIVITCRRNLFRSKGIQIITCFSSNLNRMVYVITFQKMAQTLKNISLLSIGGLRNLFRSRGVEITCFIECFDRKFYFTTFHMIVQTLPKFIYSQKVVLINYLGLGESNNMFWRKVESKVLRHNFSQDCRSITKACLS